MVAATITDRVDTHEPDRECRMLTISDGETYTSEKFAVVRGVKFSFNEDMGALAVVPGFAISDNVITFHCTGVTDKLAYVELIGNLGN
ncbi:hypothetical protein KAU11_09900 [Candidatus Babeliales bacterium]|nr:hypothetical protein [Candidatus Babeliales bacterium]